MSKKWLSVDTRQLGHDRDCHFDGFLHVIPQDRCKDHRVDITCWCEPAVMWKEECGTLLISHRDKPKEKGKKCRG